MLVAAVVVVKVSLKVTKAVDSALLLALPCRPCKKQVEHKHEIRCRDECLLRAALNVTSCQGLTAQLVPNILLM